MKLFLFTFLITYPFSLCMYDTTIVDTPDEFSMLGKLLNGTYNKPILRYGFHRTAECHDFNKAYICIQKCLDFHYDIAYADKHCYCTCYTKKEKSKYIVGAPNEEKWKLGAPTTKIPAWAQKKTTEQQQKTNDVDDHTDVEDLNGNQTDTVETNHTLTETGNSTESVTEVIDVSVGGNTTKSDNSSAVESPESNDTSTNANAVENATLAQNTTA